MKQQTKSWIAAIGAGTFMFGIGAVAMARTLPPGHKAPPASRDAQVAPIDARTVALLQQVEAATNAAHTLTADFTYSVTSVKTQQFVSGNIQMMKPNFARVRFTNLAKPAFPNLVASDGKTVYSFIPSSFRPDRTFDTSLPFEPRDGARSASGDLAGGGRIGTDPADATGANVHLWDPAPIAAFFGPRRAIERWVYTDDANKLHYAGEQTINGVTYRVLSQHFVGGNIENGEPSDFDQRLYIGSDNLIHGYLLEFTSGGQRGTQTAWLKNIRVNAPMFAADFAFTVPTAGK